MKHPALRYYGGKFNLGKWIISYFPKHDNYIEPCGGAASVLIQKEVSKLEVYNDLDSNIVNFFRVLRDRQDELIEKIRLTPYAREEFDYCRVNPCDDNLENARRFFISCWAAIESVPFGNSTAWRSSSNSRNQHVQVFRKAQENLYKVANRFKHVQIENRHARYIIERYDNKDSLIYFDLPYVKETRSHKNQYKLEVDNPFHIDCAKMLRNCKGAVIVSGYNCELYKSLYDDWQRIDKEALNNSGNKRIESIWLSPNISTVKQERLF